MNVSITAQPFDCIFYFGYYQQAESEKAKIPSQTGTSTVVLFDDENSGAELYGLSVNLSILVPLAWWRGISRAQQGKEETFCPMTNQWEWRSKAVLAGWQ